MTERTRNRAPGWPLNLAVFVIATFAASSAVVQEIYGRIWDGATNRPLAGAVVLSKNCAQSDQQVSTDRHGFYRFPVMNVRIECELSILYGGQGSSSVRVYVTSNRTLADIEARRGSNSWRLIRR